MPTHKELCAFLDLIAASALESGDQTILDLVEGFCDAHGLSTEVNE